MLATSKHNIQYLLGGYRYFFYLSMDAHGLSRYLPCFIYMKGRTADAAYVASPMEIYEQELGKFCVGATHFDSMTSQQTAASVVEVLRQARPNIRRIGIEMGFLRVGAYEVLRDGLPGAILAPATLLLELLRAVKTTEELRLLHETSSKVVDAMLAVIGGHGVRATKTDIAEALRREESARGISFDYCLIIIGRSFNRAPSDQI